MKKVNKTEENQKVIGKQEIRIELIKDTTKRKKEWLRIERINKSRRNRRNQSSNKRTEDRKKFNELDIRLIKVFKRSILNIAEYIFNGKKIKIKPVNSSLKNKQIAFCFELPFGIIYLSSYVSNNEYYFFWCKNK